jgi:nucleotidyltransferase/DNA polymerase involved in DNA repair
MSEIDHLQEARNFLSSVPIAGYVSDDMAIAFATAHATIAAAETLRDILAELRAQRRPTTANTSDPVAAAAAVAEWDPALVAAGEERDELRAQCRLELLDRAAQAIKAAITDEDGLDASVGEAWLNDWDAAVFTTGEGD